MKFLKCNTCGAIVTVLNDYQSKKYTMKCCDNTMLELIPGESDGAVEKHVPIYTQENNKITVTVGEVNHPMTEEHYIEWICITTKQGIEIKRLTPTATPKATFTLSDDDELLEVYAYCNLHGLFKKTK